ncbi:MAG: hypothetical protein JSS10_09765 [Verrucomicrobia bacterium]|nr:hypothetical protein [Verrucomicrobiota bacterium]
MATPSSSSTASSLFFPTSTPPVSSPPPLVTENIFSEKIEKERLTLTPIGQENAQNFLLCSRQLGPVNWSLNHLLQKLCSYFSRMFSGTKIQLTSGTFYIAGRSYWQECLQEKLHTETFEHQDVAEPWSFCTQPPECFEIYFCLPRKITREEFDRLIDLCLYFIASEVLSDELSDIAADLNEFGLLIRQPHESLNEEERLQRIAILIKEMRSFASRNQVTCDPPTSHLDAHELAEEKKRLGTLTAKIKTIRALVTKIENTCEIPFFEKSRLRLIFTLSVPVQAEPFSLHLFPIQEGLFFTLQYQGSPLKLLAEMADQRLNALEKDRLLAYAFNHPQFFSAPLLIEKEVEQLSPLGRFLFRYGFSPGSNIKEAIDVLTLVGFLQTCLIPSSSEAPSCEQKQDHLEIVWKCDSTTLLLKVPAYDESILTRVGENREGYLGCLTEALNLFFPRSLLTLRRQATPRALQQSEQIYAALCGGGCAYVWFLASCAAGWKKIEAEDLLLLPDWLSHLTHEAELNVVLSNLELVFRTTPYESFFDGIKKRLEALKELNPEAIRGVCLRRLMTYHESKILPAAWKLWSQSLPKERSLTVMMEISSSIRLETIPFAIPRVCDMCHPEKTVLDPAQRMQLLVCYLDRLLGLPSNEHMLIGYGPALVGPIEFLLSVDPTLESRVSASARVQNYLRSSLTVDQTTSEPEVEEIRDENWDYVQGRQEKNNRKEFNKTVNRMKQALRAKGAELQKKKGFFAVFKWTVEVLLEKKDYENVLSLLRLVAVKKTNAFCHYAMQDCLIHLMKEKLPLDAFIVYIAQFREAEGHVHVSQKFLLELFIYLVRNAHARNKLKESAVRTEIKFLHDLIKPEGKFTHDFVSCLLLYYPTLVETPFALELIKGLIAHYHLLKDHIEIVVTPLLCQLKKNPKDVKLWDKFSKLVEKLKSNPDYVLTLYESLTEEAFLVQTSFIDLPLQMIRKGMTSFEKTLSEAQKTRLAKVLAALLALAQREKKESELIRSFAAIETFMAYLEKPATLSTFTRLFLDFAGRRKINPHTYKNFCSSMLWISSHALEDNKMAEDFRTVIMGIPLKDFRSAAAQWKRAIAGAVSRTHIKPSSYELIKNLTELSRDAEEKRFFQMCLGLYEDRNYPALKSSMETYYTIGAPSKSADPPQSDKPSPITPSALASSQASAMAGQASTLFIPPPATAASIISGADTQAVAASPQGKGAIDYRSRAEALLSSSPSSPDLDRALVLLKLCPGNEFELWEKLFSFLTPESPDIYARVWKAWIEKHPSSKAREEDARYWEVAEHLLIYHLAVLLDRLPSERGVPICRVCFEFAIDSCWSSTSAACLPVLKALFALSESVAFKTKVGELHELLPFVTRVRFFLLLARLGDATMQASGQDCFLGMALTHGVVNNPALDGNMTLLQNFCIFPHIPEHEKKQEKLHEWIENSWVALKSTLSWIQALSLIEALCEFNYPANTVDPIFVKWDEIVMGTWESKPGLNPLHLIVSPFFAQQMSMEQTQSPRPSKELCHATRKMMSRLLGREMNAERKSSFLIAVHMSLKQFTSRYYSGKKSETLSSLFLFLAKCCFDNVSTTTPNKAAMQNAFNSILTELPPLANLWTTDCIDSTESFVSHLPVILGICVQHPGMMEKALEVMQLYLGTARIRNAPPEALHSWAQLLFSLCTSVEVINKSYRKQVAQAIAHVFSHCTHPSRLKKNVGIPASDHPRLIGGSCVVLSLQFLTLEELECLDPKDWKDLFQGLSELHLVEMLTNLTEDAGKKPISHLGIARIIRYAATLKLEVLRPYLSSCSKQLSHLAPDKLSLKIWASYIHAAIALLQRDNDKSLRRLRDKFIQEFIQVFFKGVQKENYERFKQFFLKFLEGIQDVTVVEKLKIAYIVPEECNSMREELSLISMVHIENRLKALKGR